MRSKARRAAKGSRGADDDPWVILTFPASVWNKAHIDIDIWADGGWRMEDGGTRRGTNSGNLISLHRRLLPPPRRPPIVFASLLL
ncbi:hypothetical protein MTP99_019615 [Tenebrio molitor]|jgi:hypothetical protein|nr:hypothetical protein MTP99_019615 [Tenebrio molitor]